MYCPSLYYTYISSLLKSLVVELEGIYFGKGPFTVIPLSLLGSWNTLIPLRSAFCTGHLSGNVETPRPTLRLLTAGFNLMFN